MGGTSRIASATSAWSTASVAAMPQLALEQQVQLGKPQRAQQQRLVGTGEPRDRGPVVEVRDVGRGDDGRRVEQDRH